MDKFSQNTIETIQHYVYCLVDPRNSKIFYIGEGCGNRVFQHATDALENDTVSDKLNTIRDIIKDNKKVIYYIIRHGLKKEVAFIIESCLIDLLSFQEFRFRDFASLTNIVSGHNFWEKGIKTTEEIEALYSAEIINKKQINHKVIIININRTYKPGISPYEATRKSWKMDINKAKIAEFVFSEYKGIIRKIYKPIKWFKSSKDNRCLFEGEEVYDKNILDLYLNKQLSDKKRGQANPIQYVNY